MRMENMKADLPRNMTCGHGRSERIIDYDYNISSAFGGLTFATLF
jgi:hypothetical protein